MIDGRALAIVICGHRGCQSVAFQVVVADGVEEITRCAECRWPRSSKRTWEVAVQHGADLPDIASHPDFQLPPAPDGRPCR